VGTVDFEGNQYLADATLRRGVLLQPGTLYTRDAVLESQKRLFQSPAIARALVVTPPAGDSIKAITVAVAETQQHHAALTLGFNTIDFAQVGVEIRHNALGSGRWLSLHGAAGNLLGDQLNGRAFFQRALPNDVSGDPQGFLRPTYQATLTLTQPWIAGARTSASISAFAGRRAIPNVVIDENAGVSLGVVRELSPRTPIGVNYRLETTRVQGSAVYFCAGYGICDAPTRDALGRQQRLAPIGVSAWVDRADDLENPTRGYTGVVDVEHASSATGSTFAHSRIAADGSMYRAIGTRRIVAGTEILPKVLAVHARAGYVRAHADRSALGISGNGEDLLHPRARFYAGGMQSVRGFAENELGPQVLQARRASLIAIGCSDATIASGQCDPTPLSNEQLFPRPIGGSSVIEANIEMRVPLIKLLGGVAFLDGASVGTSGLSSLAKRRTAITPGVGFRYRSPLGVLRLDFGLRPVGAENLPVVVAVTDAQGRDEIVRLTREKSYSRIEPSPGALRSAARRIVVHFAMGQAF
jgi:outer membrane protein assembly factor BamA